MNFGNLLQQAQQMQRKVNKEKKNLMKENLNLKVKMIILLER